MYKKHIYVHFLKFDFVWMLFVHAFQNVMVDLTPTITCVFTVPEDDVVIIMLNVGYRSGMIKTIIMRKRAAGVISLPYDCLSFECNTAANRNMCNANNVQKLVICDQHETVAFTIWTNKDSLLLFAMGNCIFISFWGIFYVECELYNKVNPNPNDVYRKTYRTYNNASIFMDIKSYMYVWFT